MDEINIMIQRTQREAGKSFVSRTRVNRAGLSLSGVFISDEQSDFDRELDLPDDHEVAVLRAVIMNPMTTIDVLKEVLNEQETIFRSLNL